MQRKPANQPTEELCQCKVAIDSYVHTRRCFMTGEYCSQLVNIQQERQKLYETDDDDLTINAFVIMNFSDMSDVVYEWRIKPFIESLANYLEFDQSAKTLICNSQAKDSKEDNKPGQKSIRIKVLRSDTAPASNYVICNRICQQIQIADLVIVDVSSQNPNVFYEFGMAVALGKMILPICYSGSFYKMNIPFDDSKLTGLLPRLELEKHIGCYPWRKTLYEYYGIMYKHPGSKTKYLEYNHATNAKYKFDDLKYARFPYHEAINGQPIGESIYAKLSRWYNSAQPEHNTLVVYTMEGFLNADQAGRCIVNFYNYITAPMGDGCFCGERVGVLVQHHPIPENDKDTQEKTQLLYNTGEIIHIGVNEATYRTAERKVEASDVFQKPNGETSWFDTTINIPLPLHEENAIRNIKTYTSNRGMIIYPHNPVYVERIRNKMTEDLLSDYSLSETGATREKPLCFYHVMLRNLRYVNQLVVDISDNSPQALFWLGTAHGSDIYAVTVVHEYSDQEREMFAPTALKKNRNIFDVAGLWTAVYHSSDTRGFYEQLALVQAGIERHSKLMLSETAWENLDLKKVLSDKKIWNPTVDKDEITNVIWNNLIEKKQRENEVLESYYRRRFWTPMLRYNRLCIYLEECNDEIRIQTDTQDKLELRARIPKWDFDAASKLTNYLSTHTVIGEYRVTALHNNGDNSANPETEKVNFICIGGGGYLASKWMQKVYDCISVWKNDVSKIRGSDINILHQWNSDSLDSCEGCSYGASFRKRVGFKDRDSALGAADHSSHIYTDHYNPKCFDCSSHQVDEYEEVAQLILWRDDIESAHEPNYYRVALSGASGTATYALSELFVDNKSSESPEQRLTLLCELQENIRKKFMDVYLRNLKCAILNQKLTVGQGNDPVDDQEKSYCQLVLYTISMYLSTVLYRYFFPFLSKRDQSRIYNDLHTYIYSMKANNISPFAENYTKINTAGFKESISNKSVNDVIGLILSEMKKTLNGFKGIEAFFNVKVAIDKNQPNGQNSQQESPLIDRRYVKGISLMQKDAMPIINYFIDLTENRIIS